MNQDNDKSSKAVLLDSERMINYKERLKGVTLLDRYMIKQYIKSDVQYQHFSAVDLKDFTKSVIVKFTQDTRMIEKEMEMWRRIQTSLKSFPEK